MGYFDQWAGAAGSAADRYGVDRSVFFGLIDAESSWNPNAAAGTTSAFGFGQLTKGTARDLGVNAHDPLQNLDGAAKYLRQNLDRFGGDYNKALAAYHDGAGALGLHGGYDYAKKVLGKAQGYLQTGKHLLGLDKGTGAAIAAGANVILPGSGAVLDGLGLTSDCGWLCQLQKWIKDSGFFQRLALAILAFIIIAAGFALYRGQSMSQVFSLKKGA